MVTCILYESGGAELARAVFHDLAGWLMMPLALAMLVVELFLLRRLIVEAEANQPAPMVLAIHAAFAPGAARTSGRARRKRRRA